ncbi:hypothetical protein ACR784_08015 [Sphingobacterium multivorum]|uniref:hypothetical protein n=1 Tax=Sphingobacterium TaxID=28453 RepID=UPI0026C39592|nr:hypothetical protein [Sphingobacterium multivorum]
MHIPHHTTPGIQLVEEYIDYHPVIFYRIQIQVLKETFLIIKTAKGDYHLMY